MTSVPGTDNTRTQSHLLATIRAAAGHVSRHLAAAQAADTRESLAHNLQHAANHTDEIIEHGRKLADAMNAGNPDIGAESVKLAEVTRSALAQAAYEATQRRMHADVQESSWA